MGHELTGILSNLKQGNYQTVLDLINSSQLNTNHMYIKYAKYLSMTRIEQHRFVGDYRSILDKTNELHPEDDLPEYLIQFLQIEIHLLLLEQEEVMLIYKQLKHIDDPYFKRLYKRWGLQLEWTNNPDISDISQILQSFQEHNERADYSGVIFSLAGRSSTGMNSLRIMTSEKQGS